MAAQDSGWTASNHYDSHALRHANPEQAKLARRLGPSKPLKDYHNQIKRALLERFAFGAPALLDLACGRGGDLLKWNDCKIGYVRGLDISPGEIQECYQRYDELKSRRYNKDPSANIVDCEFEVVDYLGAGPWRDPFGRMYDVVTCMFALHYFFKDEQTLRYMLDNISSNLKEGGYFVGTVPDGQRVLYELNNKPAHITPMLQLTPSNFQPGEVFDVGQAYVCAITDTVTSGTQVSTGSLEYMVFWHVLEAFAKEYNLYPVSHYGDPRLDALFDEDDVDAPFKHFWPEFPYSDPSLEAASALNAAFVFQKFLPGPDGTVPPSHPPP